MVPLVKKHILNLRGNSLPKKFIIFESDDWGSLRIPTKLAYQTFIKKGYLKPDDPFAQYDTLERQQDLQSLLEVLNTVKDAHGKPAVFTANTIMGNPDFKKIKASNYTHYYYESFKDTLQANESNTATFNLYQTGIRSNLFIPQFHGREHLNVSLWLKLLGSGNQAFLEAFELGCFAIDFRNPANRRANIMASYDYSNQQDFTFIEQSILEGLVKFEETFGYKSMTTIAPCYVWDKSIEEVFQHAGLKCFQGSKFQNINNGKNFKRVFHYNGELNRSGQLYLIRNCLFEPSLNRTINWVDKCMESINVAFQWKKPAVIGTHRLNYLGGLDERNRDQGLTQLKALLAAIIRRWPEAEFISSADLATYYFNQIQRDH